MENMEADLEKIGMELFPRLDDEAAVRTIGRVEELLAEPPQTQRAAALYPQWRAFICGYKLGIRPKDTQPEQDL